MLVRVRLFAMLRERAGRDVLELELPDGARVRDALERVGDIAGGLTLVMAVNREYADADAPLAPGDELALIPPVSGGANRSASEPHVAVLETPLSLDALVARVRDPRAGAVVTFQGVTRDVPRLEYEAYAEMAEKVFRELCEEIERELPGVRIAVEHRVGALEVGDIAVAIAAGAPHRQEAFRACEAMIDRLKERAPIWKKETGPDGTEWVGMGP